MDDGDNKEEEEEEENNDDGVEDVIEYSNVIKLD